MHRAGLRCCWAHQVQVCSPLLTQPRVLLREDPWPLPVCLLITSSTAHVAFAAAHYPL